MKFTKDDVIKYIARSDKVKHIYQVSMSIGFLENFIDHNVESLINQLSIAKISSLKYIDELIDDNEENIIRFVKDVHDHRKNDWRLTPSFICGLILILKFPLLFHKEYLLSNGWEDAIADIVLPIANKYSFDK